MNQFHKLALLSLATALSALAQQPPARKAPPATPAQQPTPAVFSAKPAPAPAAKPAPAPAAKPAPAPAAKPAPAPAAPGVRSTPLRHPMPARRTPVRPGTATNLLNRERFDVDKDGVLNEEEQKAFIEARRVRIEASHKAAMENAQKRYDREMARLEQMKEDLRKNPNVKPAPAPKPAPKPIEKPVPPPAAAPSPAK